MLGKKCMKNLFQTQETTKFVKIGRKILITILARFFQMVSQVIASRPNSLRMLCIIHF